MGDRESESSKGARLLTVGEKFLTNVKGGEGKNDLGSD